MSNNDEILRALEAISPADLDYQDWVNVGAALKYEGFSADIWDQWSRSDARYKRGECPRKWQSFNRGSGDTVVTGGTIFEIASRFGYNPHGGLGHELGWDDEISDDGVIVDPGWVEETDFHEPDDKDWHPVQELVTYLRTLFQSTENVGYVTDVYQNDDRLSPKRGSWDRTAGQLIEQLEKCHGDIGSVVGDVNPSAGAWIRFNPLDGNGIKNDNVTDFRYALVESDNLALGKQEAIIRQLELPVAALVYSGKKSIHAIVKVDAADYSEYKRRVEYLYNICNKNGLTVDMQNKNPSRLSRMPGVMRNGHKQFLITTNIGKSSWSEWEEWAEAVNDNLPDIEQLGAEWNNMPNLKPELIAGILREGHKMLLSGPSKAGKSYLQINLVICIAEGLPWLGRQCERGRILYVNLELDRASCLHRFRDVYTALEITPHHLENIDIWNLRGKSVPMDKLVPKLLRRAKDNNYAAVVIDPIYKVITGDENSASEMAKFCNQFDRIAADLGCAVIYCHHHSKGLQGAKRSMDRASGSGVFARDPDAMLDMIELPISDDLREQQVQRAQCDAVMQYLESHKAEIAWKWDEDIGDDDRLSISSLSKMVKWHCTPQEAGGILQAMTAAEKKARARTAWRIDATLREFPKPEPINIWFDYPVHKVDETGILADVQPDEEKPAYVKMIEAKRAESKKKRVETTSKFEVAFEGCINDDGVASLQDIADNMEIDPGTVSRWLGEGNRARKELKKDFELFTGEDGTRKIRRKTKKK